MTCETSKLFLRRKTQNSPKNHNLFTYKLMTENNVLNPFTPNLLKKECFSEVAGIGSVIISNLSKLWKVLHDMWCDISGKAAEEIWNWSLFSWFCGPCFSNLPSPLISLTSSRSFEGKYFQLDVSSDGNRTINWNRQTPMLAKLF